MTGIQYEARIMKKYDVAVLAEDPDEEILSIESTKYWREIEKNRVGNLLAGARQTAPLMRAARETTALTTKDTKNSQ